MIQAGISFKISNIITSSCSHVPTEDAEAKHCTFRPAINPVSQALLQHSSRLPAQFNQRVAYYQQRRQQAKQHVLMTAVREVDDESTTHITNRIKTAPFSRASAQPLTCLPDPVPRPHTSWCTA